MFLKTLCNMTKVDNVKRFLIAKLKLKRNTTLPGKID